MFCIRAAGKHAQVASSSTSALHTSAVRLAARAKNPTKIQQLKNKRWDEREASKPSIFLGTRPGDDAKWERCDLAKILVNEAELALPPPSAALDTPLGPIPSFPTQLAYGVSKNETNLLFTQLPITSSTGSFKSPHDIRSDAAALALERYKQHELAKATSFARLIDLRNADAKGIAHENRRRIVVAFSTPENPYDTGRTEVQVAILTYRIRNLWACLQDNPQDKANKQGLGKLVHKRAKLLKYLKRTERIRYDVLLERLALEPESVEGELCL